MKKHFLLLAALCLPALALLLLPEQAYAADEDFVSRLVHEFYTKTSTWEPTLKRYALTVFRWLVILEVCFLGIKAALNRDQLGDILKQFVMLLLMAGFFMAVINYYQEWAWNLINGLGAIGRELTPGGYSSESPFLTGMQLVKLVLDKLSIWSPGNSIALLIAALVIIVCFALISAQVVFIKCEAMIAMAAAIILVAFGGSAFLKDYAVNAIRYVLAVAFKLFVMQLVLGVGIAFIEGFSTSTAELQDIFVVIGASVVLLALVKSLPDVCAGIINGSHVSSGAALTASAAAVGGAAIGAMVAGSNTVQNVKDASKLAGMDGASGLGKAAGMAKAMWGARQDAKSSGEKALSTRTRSEMQERLERARMGNDKKNNGENS
ncbi:MULTISPECIES: P-type conjugative transfer protein TrbL [unclassified Desulfovibrio]|uniref:P-type conjugative transfer protein TrbL n=1 Tax=unclassified Desulfovibrio TaxID=2593640 RepID=UPI000F5D8F65|nr:MULTISPECIES: P-type conjugative transfer protein TrbL [unclassified Desulfovibrio]RRD71924.1 P-type conjugative transfer protein TrbL [Desulfovibrio sp. OH1209_COT-279]RRD88137.1 P-type conjugative transfer protein TrbL [Desulfovibrio sp. OH1186_COT-070]